jgi:hypothetical protein
MLRKVSGCLSTVWRTACRNSVPIRKLLYPTISTQVFIVFAQSWSKYRNGSPVLSYYSTFLMPVSRLEVIIPIHHSLNNTKRSFQIMFIFLALTKKSVSKTTISRRWPLLCLHFSCRSVSKPPKKVMHFASSQNWVSVPPPCVSLLSTLLQPRTYFSSCLLLSSEG